MRVVPLVVATAALAIWTVGAASASPASRAGGATGASFCGVGKGVAVAFKHAGIVPNPNGTTSLATLENNTRISFGLIVKAEPALRHSVPRKLKASLRKALAFVNFANAKMKAVNWDFTKLVVNQQQLVAKADAAGPSLNRLSKYFRKTCHIKGA
jgi:hypothetical protein